MQEVNRRCPLCGSSSHSLALSLPAKVFADANRTYLNSYPEILGISRDTEFPLVKCGECEFIFAGWLPEESFLTKVYEQVVDHTKTYTGTTQEREWVLRTCALLLTRVNESFEESKRPLKLLDYACGYGLMLRALSMKDLALFGYERSLARRQEAGCADAVLTDNLDEVVKNGPYNIIVCTELLEHVPDPRSVVQFLRAQAGSGALLLVTVPNIRAADIDQAREEVRQGKQVSRVLNPWEHLNYFTGRHLQDLLSSEGFSIGWDCGDSDASSYLNFRPSRRGADRVSNLWTLSRRLVSCLRRSEPSTRVIAKAK